MTLHADWIENLSKYETVKELRRSDFYLSSHGPILSFLQTPQLFVNKEASPLLDSFLRVVQWNIEKGKRFNSILDSLRNDAILKWADVIILNEAE